MKLKYEFSVREIMGDYIMVPLGEGALAVSGMGTTNEVGAFICEKLRTEISPDELLSAVLEEFDVDEATAKADLEDFIAKLRGLELIEE